MANLIQEMLIINYQLQVHELETLRSKFNTLDFSNYVRETTSLF